MAHGLVTEVYWNDTIDLDFGWEGIVNMSFQQKTFTQKIYETILFDSLYFIISSMVFLYISLLFFKII